MVPLPVATLNALLLGPGTSITHDAIKTVASANCAICWVGEDTLLFYAAGHLPTADTRNLKQQIEVSADPVMSLEVARRMFGRRFPDALLEGKSLQAMMGMEGNRVRSLYRNKAEQYKVGWKGREYSPGKFELSDVTNQIMTSMNAALYGIISSAVHSMGYSPYVGFIHSGSPLPFVYDLSDLYKEELCVELAFSLTRELAGRYEKRVIVDAFRRRVIELDILARIAEDIPDLLGARRVTRRRK